jgi:PAS domain S-box-containing protein
MPSALTELETLYASAPIGLAVLDHELRYVRINERLAEINGAPAGAHLGRTVREMVPDLGPQAEAVLRRVLETGEPLRDVEFVGETPARPGVRRTWIEHWHPVRDARGAVVGVSIVAEEVTELRRVQSELLDRNDRLQRLFQRAPGFVCILDGPMHRFEFANDAYQHLVGQRRLLGNTVRAAFPELAGQGVFERLDRVRRTGERFVANGLALTLQSEPDAPPREVRVDVVYEPIRDASGAVTGIFVQGFDVTDQARIASTLRDTEERFRVATESSLMGFAILRAVRGERGGIVDFEWVHANAAAGALLGRPAASLAGCRLRGFMPGSACGDVLFEACMRVVETGTGHDIEVTCEPGGTEAVFRNVCTKLADGVAFWFMDVTARKHAEQRLQAQTEALRVADQRKDEFLAVLAHELRNPLAPLKTALRILEREPLSGRGQQALQIGVRQTGLLARLVDDLLEVSRITRGKIELRIERFPVQRVIGEVVQSTAAAFEERAQRLVVDLPDEPVRVDADPVRLAQIVDNLLSNASKYTDRGGGITLTVREAAEGVVLAVRDAGVGIAPENLQRVFELFTQVDTSMARAGGGLGIGLALVRQLAEMHGGHVRADSDGPGHGSTFTVVLPRSRG